jgi:hypothetical protein
VTHSLHLILRCDEGSRNKRCSRYKISSAGQHIGELRDAAVAQGWTYTPGQPYHHIGGTDRCPDHSKPAPDAVTPPAAARTAVTKTVS